MSEASAPFDLTLCGATVFTPSGRQSVDVGIRGDRIAALGELADAPTRERLDLPGLTILPGVIDSQVHFREPGHPDKEDLETGTRAALLGGVTAIMEMPNTNPPTTTVQALEDKLARAAGRARVDHAFFAGASDDNLDELGRIERTPGCAGVKIFMGSSTGSLLVSDDANVLRALRSGTRRVAIHAEDEPRLKERKKLAEAEGHPRAHPVWRDAETARRGTERALTLARKAGRRVHILHVTSMDELPLLAAHKDIATFEITPQHLTLVAPDCYERLGTFAQMNPPIRDAVHRDALWGAVESGLVDVIGSDHAPHTREEKARTYPQSPSGMPGVQTLVPLMLNHVHQRRLSLERFVDLTSAGPARIYGLVGRGRIVPGAEASLTIVDLEGRFTIASADQATRCGWTPFDGLEVTGKPVMTVLHGRVAMRDGEVLGEPLGRPLRFLDTLTPEA